jgi:penicillin-insensitive murein endopeptidase
MAVASGACLIKASVGQHGQNRDEDVLAVKKLLNAAGAAIKEDGDCDRGTISAIKDYQRNWTKNPDGKVDPGGLTLTNLLQGRLKIKRQGYIVLPQVCAGNGYYSYSTMDRQFGTPQTVATLLEISHQFTELYPEMQVGIGDMSFANGAHMAPHVTHRNGRNADIRPMRTDGKMLPVDINNPDYSRDYTSELVAMFRANLNLHSILFNDASIKGVAHWEGHDNHLHVSMKE